MEAQGSWASMKCGFGVPAVAQPGSPLSVVFMVVKNRIGPGKGESSLTLAPVSFCSGTRLMVGGTNVPDEFGWELGS